VVKREEGKGEYLRGRELSLESLNGAKKEGGTTPLWKEKSTSGRGAARKFKEKAKSKQRENPGSALGGKRKGKRSQVKLVTQHNGEEEYIY